MSEYGTIKLPREDYERHNERRQNMGLSWAEYIAGQEPQTVDAEDLVTKVANELGTMNNVSNGDEDQIAHKVVEQFDYAALGTRVAEELEGRMR